MPISCNQLQHKIEVGAVDREGPDGKGYPIIHLGFGAIYGPKITKKPDGEGGYHEIWNDDFLGWSAFGGQQGSGGGGKKSKKPVKPKPQKEEKKVDTKESYIDCIKQAQVKFGDSTKSLFKTENYVNSAIVGAIAGAVIAILIDKDPVKMAAGGAAAGEVVGALSGDISNYNNAVEDFQNAALDCKTKNPIGFAAIGKEIRDTATLINRGSDRGRSYGSFYVDVRVRLYQQHGISGLLDIRKVMLGIDKSGYFH
jgi:hypothetical protein